MSTTPLVRPQSQVKIDPVAKNASSEGFSYPEIKLLNKKARISISKDFQETPDTNYHLLSVANSRGWCAAARFNGSLYELVLGPLEDIRLSLRDAKEDAENEFTPKRRIPLPGKPNIVTFANQDSVLLVGLEQGIAMSFDSAALLSPGTGEVQPVNTVQLQGSPLRQILPNPGTESTLVDKVAIVGDGTAQIFNSRLEPQGGWTASDPSTNPVSVSWSPKGKHIAIGLHSGDILTYALSQMSAISKHIPPTFQGNLVSIGWTGPGHTFRSTYSDPANPSNPALHIVSLDTKTSTGVYYSLNYPFPSGDRTFLAPHALLLPKWDEDASSPDHSKALIVYGDACSVDLEVLAHEGQNWYQQSQENPVSLPLTKAMDDTMMLSLDVDLTDTTQSTPIAYVYLNDGTIQAWCLQHSKPYPLMVTGPISAPQPVRSDTSMSTDSPVTPAPFGGAAPAAAASPFGSTGFGQPQPSFGSSGFGQPQAAPAFGQTSAPAPSGGFGAFGSANSSFTSPPAAPSTGPAFGGFGTGQSAFGNQSSTSSGFGAFGSGNNTTNAFGQTGFSANPPATSAFGAANNAASSTNNHTREASMSDGTPGFGGLSLGASNANPDPSKPAANSMFGTFGSTNTATSTNAFGSGGGGSVLKPATGFGAFAATAADSPFNKPAATIAPTAFSSTPAASTTPATSAFGKPGLGGTGFGQSGFGATGFGKTGFGQSSFGQTSQSTATPPAASASGAFSAFANKPASFSTGAPAAGSAFGSSGGFASFASKPASMTSADAPKPSGGFGAFASQPSSLSATPKQEPGEESKPAASPFRASNTTASAFGGTSAFGGGTFGSPAFSKPAATASPFGAPSANSPFGATASTPSKPAEPSPVAATLSSPPSSPESSKASTARATPVAGPATPQTPSTGGAFGNLQTTPSAFKPATGFGAFSTTPSTSPFFNTDNKTPPVSAFALSGTPSKSPSASAFGPGGVGAANAGTTTPTFGSTSWFGSKPATPASPSPAATATKVPATGGFSAFSNAPSPFSAFAKENKTLSDKTTTVESTKEKDITKDDGKREDAKGDTKSKEEGDKVKDKGKQPAESPKGDENEKEEGEEGEKPKSFADALKSGIEEETGKVIKVAPGEKEGEAEDEKPEVLSAASSYVDIGKEDGEREGDEYGDYLSDDHESDDDYVPSSDGEEEDEEEDGEGEGEEEEAPSPSGSPTTEKRVPQVRVTPTPSNEGVGQERGSSPTSPGTAEQQAPPPRRSPSPSPFGGLGLGRPSTRPARSSPLASTPLSSDDGEDDEEDEDDTKKAAQALLGMKKEDSTDSSKRPKTPPLLSAFAPSKPSASALSPPASEEKSAAPPSLFGPPPSTAGLFGAAPKQSAPANKEQTPFNLPTFTLKPPSVAMPGSSAPLPAFTPGTPSKPADSQPKPGPAPTSSFFGGKSPVPAPAANKPPTGAFGGGLFGAPIPPAGQMTAGSSAAGGFFANQPSPTSTAQTPASPFSLPSGGLFAAKSPPAAGTPNAAGGFGFPSGTSFGLKSPPSSTGTPATPGTFDMKTPAIGPSTPSQTPFGGVKVALQPPAPGSINFNPPLSTPAAGPPKPTVPEMSMEEGMQKECAMLIMSIDKELNELRQRAQEVSKKREESSKSSGGSIHKVDLGDATKWSLGDVRQFGQLLLKLDEDLEDLEKQRDSVKQTVKELTSSMLKAGTRREEIARFTKAQSDTEFSKMLKTRNLGPEHSEAQTQLRRTIRSVKDRITKLESNLQASKKKLAQSASGKVSIKAPTLDIVNRTFRNIELAISQQADDVSQLATRVARLNLAEKPGAPEAPARDSRLPDPIRRKPYNVTPNVAAVTAAALNAERAAHKLKKALLAARKEPLLNVKVQKATPPPVAFSTPGRPATQSNPIGPSSASAIPQPSFAGLKLDGAVFSPPPATPSTPASTWSLPPDDFSPSAAPLGATRRGATAPKKHGSVPLKRAPGTSPSPAPAPASFDWGPLPTFHTPPKQTSSFFKIDASKKT